MKINKKINATPIYYLLLFQIFFISPGEAMSNFDEVLNKIAVKTGREIEKENSCLVFSGSGGSLSSDEIIIHEKLIFNTNKVLLKEEGVVLISKIIKTYMKNLNKERLLEEYLERHPFDYKNIFIKIFTYTCDGEDVFHPDIESFTLQDGILTYITISASEKYYYEEASCSKESYLEAAKRLAIPSF